MNILNVSFIGTVVRVLNCCEIDLLSYVFEHLRFLIFCCRFSKKKNIMWISFRSFVIIEWVVHFRLISLIKSCQNWEWCLVIHYVLWNLNSRWFYFKTFLISFFLYPDQTSRHWDRELKCSIAGDVSLKWNI